MHARKVGGQQAGQGCRLWAGQGDAQDALELAEADDDGVGADEAADDRMGEEVGDEAQAEDANRGVEDGDEEGDLDDGVVVGLLDVDLGEVGQ